MNRDDYLNALELVAKIEKRACDLLDAYRQSFPQEGEYALHEVNGPDLKLTWRGRWDAEEETVTLLLADVLLEEKEFRALCRRVEEERAERAAKARARALREVELRERATLAHLKAKYEPEKGIEQQ